MQSPYAIDDTTERLVLTILDPAPLDDQVLRDLSRDLQAAVQATPAVKVILDLSPVIHVASALLGLVVGLHKYAQAHGKSLRVVAARPTTRSILDVTGLTRVLDCHPTVLDAEIAL